MSSIIDRIVETGAGACFGMNYLESRRMAGQEHADVYAFAKRVTIKKSEEIRVDFFVVNGQWEGSFVTGPGDDFVLITQDPAFIAQLQPYRPGYQYIGLEPEGLKYLT